MAYSLEIEELTLTELEALKPKILALLDDLHITPKWSVWENWGDGHQAPVEK